MVLLLDKVMHIGRCVRLSCAESIATQAIFPSNHTVSFRLGPVIDLPRFSARRLANPRTSRSPP